MRALRNRTAIENSLQKTDRAKRNLPCTSRESSEGSIRDRNYSQP